MEFLSTTRNTRLHKLFIVLILCLISIPIIYAMTKFRLLYGALIIIGLIGLSGLIISLLNPEIGFLILFIYSSFIFLIARIIGREDIPIGLIRDLFIMVILIGIIVHRYFYKSDQWFKITPISIVYIFTLLYMVVEFFNPNGTVGGWFEGLVGVLAYFFLYIIILHIFHDYNKIRKFTVLWLVIFLIAALYSLYQEWVGLPPYDLNWVTANPLRIGLNWSYGRWDKWSIAAGVASFGLMMSFSSVFCIVLSTGPLSNKKRLILILSAVIMILGMVFSGNRTAFASFAFGMILYALLTINNVRSLFISVILGMFLIVLIFGPFYAGKYIDMFRSAFNPHDETLELRDDNRSIVQPYILSHPIGGGVLTTGERGTRYAPDHPMAGFPPDSLYLELALEFGWIGLLLRLIFYFTIMYTGVFAYSNAQNKKIKILYLAYTCSFFAITISGYAKKALYQFPLGIILVAVYVIMDKLKEFDSVEDETQ